MKNFAILFDMDGVLVLSNPYHKKAWVQFLKSHGLNPSEEDLRDHLYGKTNPDIVTYFFKNMSSHDIATMIDEKEALYRKLIDSHIKSPKGLPYFLQLLDTYNIDRAIATSAPFENVTQVLTHLNLQNYFSAIVDGNQVSKGKPDPEIYLKVAQMIGYSPHKCIVIEDSISGIKSGINAGMKVIGITTSHTKKELYEAHLVIDNFNELTLSGLEKLIRQ